MAYGNKYRVEFSNNLNENYYIFFNKKNYTGDVTYLTGTGNALSIKSFNSDDDRFATILSKECIISIHIPASQNVSIKDFLATEDDDWKVVIQRELGEPPIFDGYMVVEESSQPLRDKPFQLHLRASDGLPLLKNYPLAKIDGTDFEGLNSITDYVTHILATINDSNVRFYFDIFHDAMNESVSALSQFQLDVKTFEKNETDYEDSYTVLEKILRDLQCRLFYENGFWHVVSLWQYRRDYGFSYWEYNTDGWVQSLGNNIIIAKVGKVEVMYPVNGDATQYYKLGNKSVKKTFNYNIPKEIVCNQQLQRGERLPGLDGSYIDTTVTPNRTIYYEASELECMLHQRNFPAPSGTPAHLAHIRREYDSFHYQKDTFIVLPVEIGEDVAIFTSEFEVGQNDLVDFSVETKAKNDYSGDQNAIIYYVFLRGDNGQNYTMDNDGLWVLSDSGFNINRQAIFYGFGLGGNAEEKNQWVTVSAESDKIPVDGSIQLVLMQWIAGSLTGNETQFKNIKIDYHPYIKDSYKPVKGDVNIYSQSLKINRTIEETVDISDSPKKIIKGSIFVNDDLATPEWFRQGFNERLRFTQIMALIKYNFSYRQFQKIEGNIKGLSLLNISDENIPFGFLPQYSFSDIPDQPLTRYILTSFEADYYRGTYRGVFVEVQINHSETYNSYDFSYLFE